MPSLEGVSWANKVVLNTDAPKEQIPLVEVLGKTLEDYPDNEGTLRALLKKDLDNKVKKNIIFLYSFSRKAAKNAKPINLKTLRRSEKREIG